MSEHTLGVHSETGTLRQVIVCRPGLAHRRLTPSNCDALLFDDVFWVKQAQKDHDVFSGLMRARGVEVLDVNELLAERTARPEEDGTKKLMPTSIQNIRLIKANSGKPPSEVSAL